ncbi:MAG: hypothetical protein HC883_01690 [Bdellovibrionaceae bacterium]|nr:hypothetical protein [Pseudobdellovibrionaceae bacterium]
MFFNAAQTGFFCELGLQDGDFDFSRFKIRPPGLDRFPASSRTSFVGNIAWLKIKFSGLTPGSRPITGLGSLLRLTTEKRAPNQFELFLKIETPLIAASLLRADLLKLAFCFAMCSAMSAINAATTSGLSVCTIRFIRSLTSIHYKDD